MRLKVGIKQLRKLPRISASQQQRAEELLTGQQNRPLTRTEQRELKELLQASEAIMLHRAEVIKRFSA
ncbi:MAG: hypothetical protein ACRD82_06410 [Blastocatellia bacterium]